jgi:hypothetical protein
MYSRNKNMRNIAKVIDKNVGNIIKWHNFGSSYPKLAEPFAGFIYSVSIKHGSVICVTISPAIDSILWTWRMKISVNNFFQTESRIIFNYHGEKYTSFEEVIPKRPLRRKQTTSRIIRTLSLWDRNFRGVLDMIDFIRDIEKNITAELKQFM